MPIRTTIGRTDLQPWKLNFKYGIIPDAGGSCAIFTEPACNLSIMATVSAPCNPPKQIHHSNTPPECTVPLILVTIHSPGYPPSNVRNHALAKFFSDLIQKKLIFEELYARECIKVDVLGMREGWTMGEAALAWNAVMGAFLHTGIYLKTCLLASSGLFIRSRPGAKDQQKDHVDIVIESVSLQELNKLRQANAQNCASSQHLYIFGPKDHSFPVIAGQSIGRMLPEDEQIMVNALRPVAEGYFAALEDSVDTFTPPMIISGATEIH